MTTSRLSNNNMVVFAGGYDGEMVEIINICREAGVEIFDKHLGWGLRHRLILKKSQLRFLKISRWFLSSLRLI